MRGLVIQREKAGAFKPLPEGEGGARAGGSGRVRGYGLSDYAEAAYALILPRARRVGPSFFPRETSGESDFSAIG
jgi:hypothetical protein